jgi:hypothetical protein
MAILSQEVTLSSERRKRIQLVKTWKSQQTT